MHTAKPKTPNPNFSPLCLPDAYRHAVDLNSRDYRAWYGLGQTYELLLMPYYALHYYRCAFRPHCAALQGLSLA